MKDISLVINIHISNSRKCFFNLNIVTKYLFNHSFMIFFVFKFLGGLYGNFWFIFLSVSSMNKWKIQIVRMILNISVPFDILNWKNYFFCSERISKNSWNIHNINKKIFNLLFEFPIVFWHWIYCCDNVELIQIFKNDDFYIIDLLKSIILKMFPNFFLGSRCFLRCCCCS